MCLLSNLHTGACESLKTHPFPLFFHAGFRVCLNTDDRLMSDTEMSKELILATETFDLRLADLERLTVSAMKSAFAPYHTRKRIIIENIRPKFAELANADT